MSVEERRGKMLSRPKVVETHELFWVSTMGYVKVWTSLGDRGDAIYKYHLP